VEHIGASEADTSSDSQEVRSILWYPKFKQYFPKTRAQFPLLNQTNLGHNVLF